MAISDDVVTVLEADTGVGGVNTLMTGGVYTFAETGRNGIGRTNTPSAFDTTTGLIKPCCVVKGRDEVPDGAVDDDVTQEISYRQVIELWFYQDGDGTGSTIASAADRALILLHGQMIGASKVTLHWVGNFLVNARADELENALVRRADYAVRAVA